MDVAKFKALAARVILLHREYDQLGYNAKNFRDMEETKFRELQEAQKEFRDYVSQEAGFKT